jgi:hypothetical protein
MLSLYLLHVITSHLDVYIAVFIGTQNGLFN